MKTPPWRVSVLRGSVATVALIVSIAGAETTHGEVALRSRPALESCRTTSFSLGGPVRRYVDAASSQWLLRAPADNPAMLEMFSVRDQRPYRNLLPWSGEFAGKYLTGTTQVLRTVENPELRAATAEFVGQLVARQAEDGYLGAFPREFRLTGKAPNTGSEAAPGDTWDLWNHYHTMVGLLLWYEDSQDAHALTAATRIGDLLCERFLNTGTPVSSTGSTEMNQSIVHGLALLHRATGEKKYLDLAKLVVEDFSAPGAGDYLRQGLAGAEFFQTPKPRWESLHALLGLAELYFITGNEDFRKAFESFWWSIAKLDRHNTGGFSSGEQAQGNPYHAGAVETCCTIAWMAMSVDMLRLTGNSIVADELELSTLNAVVGSYAPSGRWSTYNTPMNGRRIPSTQDIAFQIRPGSEELNCCSVNAARGFGMISDWALMEDGEGLVLNWYGPATIKTTRGDVDVTLRQEIDYPRGGRIVIHVEPSKAASFVLKLRIPHWSATARLTVNAEELAVQPGTYARIERPWKPGDVVQLELDMSPRTWVGERECAGTASVYHGPVLLAVEGAESKPPVFEGDWLGSGSARPSKDPQARVTLEFTGDAVEWRGAYYDDAGKARVSIDGREVDVVDQYGPQRGTPFVWRRDGLGPGPHTLVIAATGEKSAASIDHWINVGELVVPLELPTLRASDLAAAKVDDSGSDAIVSLRVLDVTGREVTLRDFGTAGQRGPYVTWLDVEGAVAAPFSPQNPLRTERVR